MKSASKVIESCLFLIFLLSIVYIANYEYITNQFESKKSLQSTSQWKHILLATAWGKYYSSWKKIFTRMIKTKCPENRCKLHTNLSAIEEMDAVLFNALSLQTESLIARSFVPNPHKKRDGQVWIFVSAEPPPAVEKHINLRLYDNFFNWTMTYRLDSDVQFPFGMLVPRLGSVDDTPSSTNKTSKVAWLVSRCESFSKREKFVEQLQRHIEVDIYGGCGKKCGVRTIMRYVTPGKEDPCDEILKNYYFYLALENSICKEYVTEKFFRALKLGLIPIVFRRSDYLFAQQDSFISVDDFTSIKQLADYLNEVIQNQELYRRYHQWRLNYTVEMGLPFNPLICDLCQQLHTGRATSKVYSNLQSWFSTDSHCITWKDLNIN